MTANIEIEDRPGTSGTNDFVIMHLSGDFNGAEENDALLNSFRELALNEKVKAVIDLRKVVYLNSASIGVLLSGNAIFKKKDGKIVLFGSSDYLENIFNVTKLNLAFDICKTEEEAIASI